MSHILPSKYWSPASGDLAINSLKEDRLSEKKAGGGGGEWGSGQGQGGGLADRDVGSEAGCCDWMCTMDKSTALSRTPIPRPMEMARP